MFKTSFVDSPRQAIFQLEGSLSLEVAATLRKSFWEVINSQHIEYLVIDFSRVPQIDPATVSLLVATKNVVARISATLVLVGLKPSHFAFLEKLNLHRYFDTHPTLDAFLSAQ